MTLKKTDIVAGYNAETLRNVFKGILENQVDKNYLIEALSTDHNGLKRLIAEGYFTEIDDKTLGFTIKGGALRLASFRKSIRRDLADKKLEALFARARYINQCDDFFDKIEEIWVFGSYLSDKELLGDIDAAVVTLRDNNLHEINTRDGIVFTHREITKFYQKSLRFLKSSDNAYSIHELNEAKQIAKRIKLVYKRGGINDQPKETDAVIVQKTVSKFQPKELKRKRYIKRFVHKKDKEGNVLVESSLMLSKGKPVLEFTTVNNEFRESVMGIGALETFLYELKTKASKDESAVAGFTYELVDEILSVKSKEEKSVFFGALLESLFEMVMEKLPDKRKG